MQFLEMYGKEIFSLLVPLLAWTLNNFFKAKAKLQYAVPHQFTFLVQEPRFDNNGAQISSTQTLKTQSFVVRNSGRESATKIEMVFNWKPMCLNLWPVRHFTEHIEQDKRYVLLFDSLAPNEIIGCEIMAVNYDLPELITVRSDQCVAQNIAMYPQPVVRNSVRAFATLLIALGFAAVIYISIFLVQFLVLRTPYGL